MKPRNRAGRRHQDDRPVGPGMAQLADVNEPPSSHEPACEQAQEEGQHRETDAKPGSERLRGGFRKRSVTGLAGPGDGVAGPTGSAGPVGRTWRAVGRAEGQQAERLREALDGLVTRRRRGRGSGRVLGRTPAERHEAGESGRERTDAWGRFATGVRRTGTERDSGTAVGIATGSSVQRHRA